MAVRKTDTSQVTASDRWQRKSIRQLGGIPDDHRKIQLQVEQLF